jgi:hypothetical protein
MLELLQYLWYRLEITWTLDRRSPISRKERSVPQYMRASPEL